MTFFHYYTEIALTYFLQAAGGKRSIHVNCSDGFWIRELLTNPPQMSNSLGELLRKKWAPICVLRVVYIYRQQRLNPDNPMLLPHAIGDWFFSSIKQSAIQLVTAQTVDILSMYSRGLLFEYLVIRWSEPLEEPLVVDKCCVVRQFAAAEYPHDVSVLFIRHSHAEHVKYTTKVNCTH